MKNIKFFVLFALPFFALELRGQNLVVNPSFETIEDTLHILTPGEHPVSKAIGWSLPTRAQGSLLYSLIAVTQVNRSIQKWRFTAKSGDNVAAITTYGTVQLQNDKSELREYVQGSLKEPLVVGKKYYVEYWVHFHCEGTNNIGMVFQKEPLHIPSVERLNLKPQVNYEKVIPYSETIQWHLVRDSFIAKEAFTHFVIGNFKSNTETKIQSDEYHYHKAYLDEIKVEAAENNKMPRNTPDMNFSDITNVDKTKDNSSIAVTPTNLPKKGEILILDKVFFKFNSTDLESESANQLDKLVDFMNKNESMTILIKGHTSSEGGSEYNLKLSEQRAKAVMLYAVSRGIKADRLSHKGFGETQPIANNETEEGKSKNRRVEFEIIHE
jgi:outer membrane protein OmpA-like peptidoglycan-associated protein